MKRPRLASCGLSIESCTFSPLRTVREDFRILRGAACFGRCPFLEDPAMSVEPILHAGALPGGPVTADAYRCLKEEIVTGLAAGGPWHGVYLDLHGAMAVEGMDDAEADLLAAVRSVVGDDPLLVASFDLHGNLSDAAAARLDGLSAYRTAPHIDELETRERAWRLLTAGLRAGRRPHLSCRRIPVALPGEKTSTEWEPGRGIYQRVAEVGCAPGVLDASLLVGYAWADEPRTGAAAAVTAWDGDTAREHAAGLARRYWDARSAFDFGVRAGTIHECLAWAGQSRMHPVLISDSGDNPTGGGVGDVPVMLSALLEEGVDEAVYASIWDADAVRACARAGVGSRVALAIGGRHDTVNGCPLDVSGVVANVVAGDSVGGLLAVLRIGGVQVVLTECRKPFHCVADFTALGIDPVHTRLVVVKVGYMVPELKAIAGTLLLALSPGVVNQALGDLPFRRVQRPLFPLDPAMTWSGE